MVMGSVKHCPPGCAAGPGGVYLIRVITSPAFLSSICSVWRPARICGDLHSRGLEVHVRLFCKKSPEPSAEIKVQGGGGGAGFYVRLGGWGGCRRLGGCGSGCFLPGTETAVPGPGLISPAVAFSGADPIDRRACSPGCWGLNAQHPNPGRVWEREGS